MTRLVTSLPNSPQYKEINVVPLKDVTKFQPNDIFHVFEANWSDGMEKLLSEKGMPAWIINDYWTTLDWASPKNIFYTCNTWLGDEVNKIYRNSTYTDSVDTEYACVIMINKKQVNRYLALKLAELFKIDFKYTWSGIGRNFDMGQIITELDQSNYTNWMTNDQRNFLLAPIQLEKQWIVHPQNSKEDLTVSISNLRDIPGYDFPWSNGLESLGSKSAVHIITESVSYQRGSIFTEKTVYSVLGLNFPVWVGGCKQADEWKKHGFDIFDDVINHDYQHFNTLIERCWWAFALNLDIMQDKNYAAQLRQKYLPRLINNRNLLLNGQLDHNAKCVLDSWPDPVKNTGSLFLKKVYNIV
jgi:hypothetical protein